MKPGDYFQTDNRKEINHMELDWEREEPRDNVIAGTVGAFLGSLIGVACIVLVD